MGTQLLKVLAMLSVVSTALHSSRIAGAQEAASDPQRAAMQRLAFLAGNWSGPVNIYQGPNGPLQLTQSEDVQFKLDGLILLIQGRSTGHDGKEQFSALAVVSFDKASQTYRIRAYHGGDFVETEFVVVDSGFSWTFSSGPARISNTMRLTDKGGWAEDTAVTFGSNPPFHSMDMLLTRHP